MDIVHYVNGRFVSKEDALISAFDLSVLRGYGVFDYVQLYKGKPFYLLEHLKRLAWSADQVELELPMSLDEISTIFYLLLEKNPPIDAGVRFVLTCGIGSSEQIEPMGRSNLMLLFHPITLYPIITYEKGMKAALSRQMRVMPEVKSTHYLPAILSMKEAKRRGFDDALYINDKDEILEGTTCNAFFFIGDRLITADSKIVRGVTRSIFLELAKEHFEIEYRPLKKSELKFCDEAFLTSSIKDAVPLVQVEDQIINQGLPGKRTAHLRELFREHVNRNLNQEIYHDCC